MDSRTGPEARGRRPSLLATLRVLAVLALVAGVAGSLLLARAWGDLLDRQRDERLERMAVARTASIRAALEDYQDVLFAERALFLGSTTVTRSGFAAFASNLDLSSRYPGLHGIGWIAHVPGGDAERFVAGVRADMAPAFEIQPPGRRDAHYVHLYEEPSAQVGPRIGQDARVDVRTRRWLDQARDTGKPVVSAAMPLAVDEIVPEAQRPAAYRIFMAVYRGGSPATAVAERRAALIGWTVIQFRARDYLIGALATTAPYMGVQLFDTSGGDRLVAAYPSDFSATGPEVQTGTFADGGRRWTLRYASLPGSPLTTERRIEAPVVAAIGIALSVLLAALLWIMGGLGGAIRKLGAQGAELRMASEFKTDLIAMLSHDLRQPLASTLGYAELLTDDWEAATPESRKAFALKVVRSARRLDQLVEGILTMTKVDAGGLAAERVPVLVDQAIRDALGALDHEPGSMRVGHLDPGRVLADPNHVQQILANVLGNAVKYGAPPFEVTATRTGDEVKIVVADAGPGVPPEFVPRLFDRFTRASETAATKKGTGLGMFIVRQLVEANGGSVRYEPGQPTGARFVITLPVAPGSPAAPPPPRRPVRQDARA
jgi:signal transduction histidine kinase